MLSHVCIGVEDVERAYAFYAPLMEALGLRLKFRNPPDMAGWMPAEAARPLFLVCRPFDGQAPAPAPRVRIVVAWIGSGNPGAL